MQDRVTGPPIGPARTGIPEFLPVRAVRVFGASCASMRTMPTRHMTVFLNLHIYIQIS
jgi:hypothetical protein